MLVATTWFLEVECLDWAVMIDFASLWPAQNVASPGHPAGAMGIRDFATAAMGESPPPLPP